MTIIKHWFYKIKSLIDSKEIKDKQELLNHIQEIIHYLLEHDVVTTIINGQFDNSYNLPRKLIKVGNVLMGGNRPPVVQTMAINSLQNLDKLHIEFKELVDAGAEIVRIAVTGREDAANLEHLKTLLVNTHYDRIPIVMCGQYNVAPIIKNTNILNYISKLRINPGNISKNAKDNDNFEETILHLIEHNKNSKNAISVRVGVNWGSLDENFKILVMDINSRLGDGARASEDTMYVALVTSCVFNGLYAYMLGLSDNLIVVSCKTSDVKSSFATYKLLAMLCDFNIHLGVTEAGQGDDGVVITAAGLSPLLLAGIGSTVRVSITPKLNESRTKEVLVCKQILQAVGVRQFSPRVVSCPGCGRTDSSYFRELAEEAKIFIDQNIERWCLLYENNNTSKDDIVRPENSHKQIFNSIRGLRIAVMGCLVNGPGESKHADIGISLPGFGESHAVLVYIDGVKHSVLRGGEIKEQFFEIIENYIKARFSVKILQD